MPRPEGAWPLAPKGFQVTEFARGLSNPRKIVTAPNGDIFVAESMPGRIKVLRDADGDGKPEVVSVFASGLSRPFGIAFYPLGPKPDYLYVGNTDSVVRFPYKDGDTKAEGQPEMLVKNIPSGRERVGGGGHWTRDLEFSKDGKILFVSVGSRSNVSDGATVRTAREPTSWPSIPTARMNGSTPTAFAMRSAWRSTPRPASSGRPSTNATCWATTWSPTTSPTSRRAASTAGPGITWARTRTPVTRGSTPS